MVKNASIGAGSNGNTRGSPGLVGSDQAGEDRHTEGNAMAKTTHLIRISDETRRRLDCHIAMLVEAYEKGHVSDIPMTETRNPRAALVSYDAFIARMLDQREGHQARAEKHKRKKRG